MSDQMLSSTLGQEGASVAVHYNSNSTQAAAEDTVMAIKAAGSDAFAVESAESIAYHKSQSMKRRLTEVRDIVPIVKFLVTEGWWITGQTLFANGGYTTR